MDPKVRNLYKRFIIAGRAYPKGLEFVRNKAKEAFFANKDITGDIELKKAISKGRWWVKELHAISGLAKYRTMKKRYS